MTKNAAHLAPPHAIADSTAKQYQEVAGRLIARARKENSVSPDQTLRPDLVVDFLTGLMPTIKAKSFRFYKAALVYHFEQLDTKWALIARNRLKKLSTETVGSLVKERRTSSQKSKHLNEADLKRIKNALLNLKTPEAIQTLGWLEAALLTGLRPQEWCNAALQKTAKGIFLKVKNLKNTQDRSHGEIRRIDLTDMSNHSVKIIETHLAIFKITCANSNYETVYTKCRQLLHKTDRSLFPKRKLHVTLYTGRHQFAANAKRSFDKVTVAALLGHRSLETAGRFYGLSTYGSGGLKARPSDEDRQAVIAKNPGKDLPATMIRRQEEDKNAARLRRLKLRSPKP